MPTLLLLRRVMEECGSVEEAAALIRSVERAASLNLALCDRQRGAILEITPKTVALRAAGDGVAICTNHFRSAELATSTKCWRYESLERSIGGEKFTIADIAKRLHAVNQGESTMQSMIFEPATFKLHLTIGKGPATARPMRELELAGMLVGKKSP
jgi:isopenicillin-N N-acyltransferase like protein